MVSNPIALAARHIPMLVVARNSLNIPVTQQSSGAAEQLVSSRWHENFDDLSVGGLERDDINQLFRVVSPLMLCRGGRGLRGGCVGSVTTAVSFRHRLVREFAELPPLRLLESPVSIRNAVGSATLYCRSSTRGHEGMDVHTHPDRPMNSG